MAFPERPAPLKEMVTDRPTDEWGERRRRIDAAEEAKNARVARGRPVRLPTGEIAHEQETT